MLSLYQKTRLQNEGLPISRAVTSPLFFEAPQVPAGTVVKAVVSGDFNHDGKTDLAIADYCLDGSSQDACLQSGSTVNVLLGNGDGTFQPLARYATATGSIALVIGDFDNDGNLDIAVTNICSNPSCVASSISILLGKGDGTFKHHVDYATGLAPFGIAVGDLNGDGKQDLVTADFFNAVSVVLGNGDGTFQPNNDLAMSCDADACGSRAIVIGDFNGDHKADLVTANYYGFNLSLFLGNGDGTFETQSDFARLGNPSTLATGDLNGDGKLDIVTNNINGNLPDSLVVLLGNGDGTFQLQVAYFTGVDDGPTQLVIDDFGSGMKADLAAVNVLGNSVSVFGGAGDGTYPTHQTWGAGGASDGLAAGDFNGDGRVDIATLNISTNTIGLLLAGDKSFQASAHLDTYVDPEYVATADFNRDGRVDLVTVNPNYSTVSVLLAAADGRFQPHVEYTIPSDSLFEVIVGDFNLDGNSDFAVGNSSVSFFLGRGDGTFESRIDLTIDQTYGRAYSLASSDFNGDGKPDLAVSQCCGDQDPIGNVAIFLGNGDGTFKHKADYPVHLPGQPGTIRAADFNGDGTVDLAVSNPPNGMIFLGNGDGTFAPPINSIGPIVSLVATDFNNDGRVDLAGIDPSDSGVKILLGNGDGTFQPYREYSAGGSPFGLAVGDFDGDGNNDLAVANQQDAVVLMGNGDGTLRTPRPYTVGGDPVRLAVADFDADGKPDLAVANALSDDISLLLNIADIPMFTVSAGLGGQGKGTLTLNPGGFVCRSDCSRSYASRTVVGVAAVADSGSIFEGWSGGGCSGTGPCYMTLTSDQTVTATFTLAPDFSVSVTSLSPGIVNPGQSATATINVTAINGFNSSVAFSCSVSPKPQLVPQCSVSPTSVNIATPATLTVTTTAPTSARATLAPNDHFFLAFWLPILGLTLTRKTFVSVQENKFLGTFKYAALCAALLVFSGCGDGGGSHGAPGTPAGGYAVTIIATSGSTHSSTVMLSVQ
ncbi:MAG TPA: FG-GAP-like repeat-containing protein [Candidatus Sulfotelmatobacter sp.]|nr:FG-GAP-like repeat-containing protein [Candidatus Sulfotelmatobacter sp.]